ncbi:MAG: endo-1,4-beta-xylanase [Candidatus Nomurabacteria bacterium]|nr:endo-1,4-beta-xylanase [Candidatus Nomurabacteria bacterium]
MTVLFTVIAAAFLARFPFAVKAAPTPIAITIDGVAQTFATTPYIDPTTNVALVPLEEIFAKLNIPMTYNSNTKTYLGAHARSSIALTLDSSVAYYDATPITLGTPTAVVSGTAMLDLSFIGNFYGVTLDQSSDRVQVKLSTKATYNTFTAEDKYAKQIDALAGADVLKQPSAVGSNHGSVYFTPSSTCANSEVTVSGQSFTNAIQNASFTKNMSALHTCQLQYKLGSTVKAGDVLIIKFVARTTETENQYGNAYARLGVAKADGSSSSSLHNDVAVITADWQTFYIPFDTSNLSATLSNNDRLHLHTAYGKQTIQIGDMQLINLGKTVDYKDVEKQFYRGQSSDAVWRKVALKRIENHRRAPVNVVVKDTAGNPIHDAEVTVEMIKNEFIFGTALNTPDLAGDPKYSVNIPPFFDLVGPENAFKWINYEADACAKAAGADYIYDYALKNNYSIRGHNLLWDEPQYYPAYADYNSRAGCTKNSPVDWATISEADAAKIISAHISEIVSKYPEVIEWDVWNEPTGSNKRFLRNRFGEKFFVQFFKLVEALNPKAKKYVNDFYLRGNHDEGEDELIALIQKLTAAGAKVDGLGAQTHVTGRAYPQDIYNQIDNVGKYVDEIAITEYNIRSTDEALGGDYIRDALILAYSNPKIKEFVNWSYRDKADGSRSSLVRYDYTKKPAYYAMENQIKAWTTNASGKTDKNGAYSVDGYKGTYRITARFGTTSEVVSYQTSDTSTVTIVLQNQNTALPDCGAAGHEALSSQTFTGDILRVPSNAKTVAEINAWIAARASGTIIFAADFTLDDAITIHGTKNMTLTSEQRVAILQRGATFSGSMINGNSSATITLENVVIDGANTANPITGQAVQTSGNLTMSHATIRNNHSSSNGAGLAMSGSGKLNITGSLICNNTAATTNSGGGIHVSGTTTANIASSYLIGNKATSGGGISAINTATLNISDNVITKNTAGQGGAIYATTNNIILTGAPKIGLDSKDNGIYLASSAVMKIVGDLVASSNINVEQLEPTRHGRIVASKQDAKGQTVATTAPEAALFHYQPLTTPVATIIHHKTNYILSELIYNSLTVTPSPLAVSPNKISSSPHMVRVESNNHTGYILTLSTTTTDNSLRHDKLNATIPAIASATPTTVSSTVPAWGYRMDGLGAFGLGPTTVETDVTKSAFTWAAVPTLSNPVVLRSTNIFDTGYVHNSKVFYIISAPKTLPAGFYSTTIMYTLVPQI